MKIIQISSVPYGSIAKIMIEIAAVANKRGHFAYVASGYSTHPISQMPKGYMKIGNVITKLVHLLLARITGLNGCFSWIATKLFLKEVKKINPDIIHIHNLHGWYINIPTLFSYFKKQNIQVIWTLHDCWPITGHCPHFDMIRCEKWKRECCDCLQYRSYPQSLIDNSKYMHKLKKKWFMGLKDLIIVTPSFWLSQLVQQSFLGEYTIKVINNGIDLSVFKPQNNDFKNKNNCENKFIILGVALGWNERKGLDVFIDLAKCLEHKYKIVLVGMDKDTGTQLPQNIMTIPRTQNSVQLAELYSMADVFVNPTREDTYPTVNMEALACGTPVITFRTGGSPEMIDETCGVVVERDDIDTLQKEIVRVCMEKPFSQEQCIKKAQEFDANQRFKEYIELYESVNTNRN